MNSKLSKTLNEIRSLATLVLIIFLLKVTIVEAYIVPTGSMENTIMTGDFLIGSRFNYGMRTPDWIGVPYTDKGFNIPHIRFPGFKKPEQGDIIIFKYPRDPIYKYVKRCIAGPGDVIKIENRKVFVNVYFFKPGNNHPKNSRLLSLRITDNTSSQKYKALSIVLKCILSMDVLIGVLNLTSIVSPSIFFIICGV